MHDYVKSAGGAFIGEHSSAQIEKYYTINRRAPQFLRNAYMNMPFETVLRDSRFLLTEGAIVERLKNEYHVTLDDHINHAGLIYDAHDNLATL